MDTFLEALTEVLNSILPAPYSIYLSRAILLVAIMFAIYLVMRQFSYKNSIYITPFSIPDGEKSLDGLRVAEDLMYNIKKIQQIHSEEALTAVSYASSVGSLKHVNENIENNFIAVIKATIALDAYTNLLVFVFDKLTPHIELHGEVSQQDNEIRCIVRLIKSKKQLTHWMLGEVASQSDALSKLLEKVSYQIVIDITNRKYVNKSFSVGTTSWQALKFHTDALNRWQSPVFHIERPENVEMVDKILGSCIECDQNYAMAYYNRGILNYLAHINITGNRRAKDYFKKAVIIINAENSQDRVKIRRNKIIEGLAWIGLSRCYCQEWHRYGYRDIDIVNQARDAARRAIKLLGNNNIKALHALAFSWHCTEDLSDIEKGKEIYEKVTKKYPGKYAHFHNNLGYILMIGGQKLSAKGDQIKAKQWYSLAQYHMEKVIEIEKRSSTRLLDFAHANLGNLFRLRKDYQKSIDAYMEALRWDLENSTYTNGLNELSLVYCDMRDFKKALHLHRRSLQTTDDYNQQVLLVGRFIKELKEVGVDFNTGIDELLRIATDFEQTSNMGLWISGLDSTIVTLQEL